MNRLKKLKEELNKDAAKEEEPKEVKKEKKAKAPKAPKA